MAYKTHQRQTLLTFFEDHPDHSFSVTEIAEALKDQGISISAIYRNLAELEKDNRVRKTTRSGSREAYYQILDCDHCRGHIHMHCMECGKTTHLEEKEADALLNVLGDTNFSVDTGATVLYGVCGECSSHHKEGK